MSRLTRNDVENTSITFDELDYNPCALCDDLTRECTNSKITECFRELIEYKAIEEELGVDLITLFKQPYCTLFVWKDYGTWARIEKTTLYSIIPQEKCIVRTFDDTKYYWKDYGKTWALTREELEND